MPLSRRECMAASLLARFDAATYPLPGGAREFAGLSLLDMAADTLRALGVSTRDKSKPEIARLALRAGGMMSTADLPNALADVANKSLRQAYERTPRTFTGWARQVSTPDFKGITRVQLSEAPRLERVNEHGEYKRGSLTDARQTYRLTKWGKVLPITWETIVNDDLDALTRIPALFGASAADLEADLVYSVLLANANMADGTPLFHANHGNLGSGAINVTNLGAARAAMRLQRGLDGQTLINLAPRYMLVPASLETTAEQLFASITPAQVSNVVPPSFRSITPIPEPRLDAGVTVDGVAYSGSAAAWYLAADKAQIDTIEYCYLEGEEGVHIETRSGFDVDGMEIKARLVFAAAAMDHRGLYKSTGV